MTALALCCIGVTAAQRVDWPVFSYRLSVGSSVLVFKALEVWSEEFEWFIFIFIVKFSIFFAYSLKFYSFALVLLAGRFIPYKSFTLSTTGLEEANAMSQALTEDCQTGAEVLLPSASAHNPEIAVFVFIQLEFLPPMVFWLPFFPPALSGMQVPPSPYCTSQALPPQSV